MTKHEAREIARKIARQQILDWTARNGPYVGFMVMHATIDETNGRINHIFYVDGDLFPHKSHGGCLEAP